MQSFTLHIARAIIASLLVSDTVPDKLMDDYLDGAIGSKICLLPDLLRGLQKEEAVLQGQVC